MTLSGPTRLLAAAGAVVALTITAPAEAGGSRAATGKPAVGECRNLTLAQASARSNNTGTVRCSSAHNDRVIAVRNLPKGVTYAQLNTAAKVDTMAVRLCFPSFRGAVSKNDQVRNRSAYSYLYFVPSAKQRNAGARWLRCDLTLRAGASLAKLPTDRKPALRGKRVPSSVARCLAGKALVTTRCSSPHKYRAAAAVTIAIKKYPSRKQMIKIGRSRCPKLITTDADYRFTWTGKAVWTVARDHTLVCYNRNG